MYKINIFILGGYLKNKKIIFTFKSSLRPTKNIIKKTLFNWISPIIYKSKCLDCFSGSGSLGFESISRGCNNVTFLEKNKKTTLELKKNLKRFNINNAKIINTNSIKWLKKKGNIYDIVYIDPPFNKDMIFKTIYLLIKNYWVNYDSFIYIESEKENLYSFVPNNWFIYKKKITGQTLYLLYKCDYFKINDI
ncbi:MAG: 16S rRNA (guanine(966)-N(2))-methyltransferase RsmD [Enterobacterales bacterium]